MKPNPVQATDPEPGERPLMLSGRSWRLPDNAVVGIHGRHIAYTRDDGRPQGALFPDERHGMRIHGIA